MKLTFTLSKSEAEAVLRAELSAGVGVRRSQSLQAAEFKIRQAIIAAQKESDVATADRKAAPDHAEEAPA